MGVNHEDARDAKGCTMKVAIHANSEAPIGNLVERLLETADDVFIASAYISAKAIDTLSARTKQRTSGSLCVDILFGLDAETDLAAVQRVYDTALGQPKRFQVRYTPHRAGRLFHPKVYFFQHRSTCHIIIASANLTGAGQYTNEELYCHLECPVTHEAVAQFNAVRKAWMSEPFSAMLDEKVIGAKEGIDYHRQQLIAAEKAFANVISNVGVVTTPVQPVDSLAPLRAVLSDGYLIAPAFSLSSLYVSVQDILKPTDGTKPDRENQVVIVQNRSSAVIKLLPEEKIKDFGVLQRTAREVCEGFSLSVPAGLFVPRAAHKELAKSIVTLKREQNVLVNSLIKKKTIISQHLKENLEKECKGAWKVFHPEESSSFPEGLLLEVRKRVEERRTQLEKNPDNALRFHFQAYPHPLVLMKDMPDNLAWTLQKIDPDREIVRTIVALLRGQARSLLGVTQWSKPSIIKRDFERVKFLITIKGKFTDSLLHNVSSWVRESQIRQRGQTSEQKKNLLDRKATFIKDKVDEHILWLNETESLEIKEAVLRLSNEYPCLQLQQ